jgi:hypothetical protein
MATAKEWAERLGTTILTEEQFIQLHDRKGTQHITSMSGRAIDTMSLSEVDEYVADRKARGEGLVGVLPPSTGPGDLVAADSPLGHALGAAPNREFRQKMRLVFVDPDPNPELADPTAVTFTPEDAIAIASKQHSYGMRVYAEGPISDIKAALMTVQEARALLDHGTPPGRPGTTPGALVCLVVIHGSFVVVGPPGPNEPNETKLGSSHIVAFEVFDTRKGHVFWAGARTGDIVLP